ncbi:hypothetical protein V9L20_21375 [Variovorax sp. CCNWLW225]|uniref:hypothetical protein n=1 Tax=Variovorax sp. CCNWLW225 TaxID=3127462 RepID=UPI00307753A9
MTRDNSSRSGFTAVSWKDHSSVDIGYQVARIGREEKGALLRICFSGEYGIGADGNRDATYMDAMVRAACDVIRPDGVILDFSAMSYQWGDLLGKVLRVPERWEVLKEPPFAIVDGPGCRDALRSLLTEDLGWDGDSLDWVFQAVEHARDLVELRIAKNTATLQKQLDEGRREKALAFWNLLGDELGPDTCRSNGCTRLRIKDSVLCRVHHFEKIQHTSCPFT